MVTFIEWVVGGIGIYLAIGSLFAVPFSFANWVGRLDHVAMEGTWGFRVLIIPGVAALWPLFVIRLLRGKTQPPVECNAHRRAAR